MSPSRELKIKVPGKKHTDASITSNPDQRAQPWRRGQDKRILWPKSMYLIEQFRENCIFGNPKTFALCGANTLLQSKLSRKHFTETGFEPALSLSWKNDSRMGGTLHTEHMCPSLPMFPLQLVVLDECLTIFKPDSPLIDAQTCWMTQYL